MGKMMTPTSNSILISNPSPEKLIPVQPLTVRDFSTLSQFRHDGCNVHAERRAFMTNQFTGETNFTAIRNVDLPNDFKNSLQQCL